MLARLFMKVLRGVPVSPSQVCTDPTPANCLLTAAVQIYRLTVGGGG